MTGGSETPRPLNLGGSWMLPPTVTVACRHFLGRMFASAQVEMRPGFLVRSSGTEVWVRASNSVAWAGSGSGYDQIPERRSTY